MWLVLRVRSLGALALGLTLVASLAVARMARANGGKEGGGDPSASIRHNVIWRVPTTAPEVAITFDDGPDPTYTPQVLRQLANHGATATFFVLGIQAERYPGLVRSEVAEGSEVCNHGWAHQMLRGRSAATVEQDVVRTQAVLKRTGLPECDLFRFPYFASDATARMTVARLGYRMIAANVDTEDWRGPAAQRMADGVLARIRPGDIILFHDAGGQRDRTVQAVGMVLDGLPRHGLRAVTVGALLKTVDHGRPPAPGEE